VSPGRWGRLLGDVRRGDIAALAILVSSRLRGVDGGRRIVIEKRLGSPSPLLLRLRARAPELRVRLATAADVPLLARVFPTRERGYSAHPGGDEGRYAERFARRHDCLLVESDGAPVAMSWLEFDDAGPAEEAFHLAFPAAACWGYDTFVLPEYRQKGAFAVLSCEMFDLLRARGLDRVFASVDYFNALSRAAHARLGYEIAAIVDRVEVGHRRLVRIDVRPGRVSWLHGDRGMRATVSLSAEDAPPVPGRSWPALN
jgi:GNAT superfamily N-acetyltransferase